MALRLYQLDSYLRECDAVVTAIAPDGEPHPDGTSPCAIALAQTVFYPPSGGQPADTGWLNDIPVVDVRDEAGEIWHILELDSAAVPHVGATVTARIDWKRRFDHMQQHTGQHILSAAFLRALDAQTVAVHMGMSCTLDLSIGALTADQAATVEDLANGVVLENREVMVREVEPDEIEALGLRRPPKQTGRIRVVEVAGFDRSACGGTHVAGAGEVGPIAVPGWERHKGGVRVEFLCGWRALRAFRRTHTITRDLAAQFSASEHELPPAVQRLRDRVRAVERDLAHARTALLAHEAADLVSRHQGDVRDPALTDAPPIIAVSFTGRAIDELRELARLVTTHTPCVAIFVSEPDRRLMIVRSAGIAADAAVMLRESLAPFEGRGGGKPEAAEGMAAAAPSVGAVMAAARAVAQRHLVPLRGSPR